MFRGARMSKLDFTKLEFKLGFLVPVPAHPRMKYPASHEPRTSDAIKHNLHGIIVHRTSRSITVMNAASEQRLYVVEATAGEIDRENDNASATTNPCSPHSNGNSRPATALAERRRSLLLDPGAEAAALVRPPSPLPAAPVRAATFVVVAATDPCRSAAMTTRMSTPA